MSTIHIDPKNKGKFNALKKRTGKSTEELTHSKNPLTRKRAIFAQNAKKWNHEEGGVIIPNFKFGDIVKDIGSLAFGAGSGVASGLTFGLSDMVTKPIGQKLMASDGKITPQEQAFMNLGNTAGSIGSMFINPAGGVGDIAKKAAAGTIKMPLGGVTNMQPAELEKQENVLMPNGQGKQFDGASHEAGGINTILPEGTMVFTDTLKTPEGKTFADANKPFLSNIKNSGKNAAKYIGQDRKWSENSKKAAQANSSKLFNQQEAMKNEKLMKAVNRAYKKYGGKIYAKGGQVGQEITKGALENTGNLMYLFEQGKDYDTVKYNPITPDYMKSNEAINNIKGQSSIAKYNISNVSGGNAGSYLSNVIGLNNATNRSISQVQENYDNQNAQIGNQFKQINEQNRQVAEEKTAANKGTALSTYYDTLGQTGKNVANRWSTAQLSANQAERDQQELQWFKKLYPYIFNK